jgi:hypothetical protein
MIRVAVWRFALIVRPAVEGETGHMPEEKPDLVPVAQVVAGELVPDPPATRPSGDDVGEASFPASDPPAVWTWDPPPPSR